MALDVVAARRRRPDSPFSPSCAAVRDWKVVSPEGIEPRGKRRAAKPCAWRPFSLYAWDAAAGALFGTAITALTALRNRSKASGPSCIWACSVLLRRVLVSPSEAFFAAAALLARAPRRFLAAFLARPFTSLMRLLCAVALCRARSTLPLLAIAPVYVPYRGWSSSSAEKPSGRGCAPWVGAVGVRLNVTLACAGGRSIVFAQPRHLALRRGIRQDWNATAAYQRAGNRALGHSAEASERSWLWRRSTSGDGYSRHTRRNTC